MLAPLVMDLSDKKIPVKIVSLGHRSGAVIMVRTDSGVEHFRQLEGKRIAIPSRFAVDFLFLRKMLAREEMTPEQIQIVEMPPPDMPAALLRQRGGRLLHGEPFGAAAQRPGYADAAAMTRDEWRNYICCVLTVREELIAENRPLVQDLVDHVLGAGRWLDASRATARRRSRSQPAPGTSTRTRRAALRDGEPERPRHVRRPAHDPAGVRRADAALDRRGTIASRSPSESYLDESFASDAKAAAIPI
jgi:NitT/TauT family transport system substrate-binding protein